MPRTRAIRQRRNNRRSRGGGISDSWKNYWRGTGKWAAKQWGDYQRSRAQDKYDRYMKKSSKFVLPQALQLDEQLKAQQPQITPKDVEAYYTEKIDMVYFEILKSLKNYQNYNMIELDNKIKKLLNQIDTQNYVGKGGLIEGGTYGKALREYVQTLSTAPTLKEILTFVSNKLSIKIGESSSLIDLSPVGSADHAPVDLLAQPSAVPTEDLLAPSAVSPAGYAVADTTTSDASETDKKPILSMLPNPAGEPPDPFAKLNPISISGGSRRRRRSRRR